MNNITGINLNNLVLLYSHNVKIRFILHFTHRIYVYVRVITLINQNNIKETRLLKPNLSRLKYDKKASLQLKIPVNVLPNFIVVEIREYIFL